LEGGWRDGEGSPSEGSQSFGRSGSFLESLHTARNDLEISLGIGNFKQETGNRKQMKLTQLARGLGISKGQASKLAARGMPTSDLEAAKAWRTANLDPAWAKPSPPAPPAPPSPLAHFVLHAHLATPCRPEFIVAALLDAGFRGFTGKQVCDLAALICLQWMDVAIAIIGDKETLFDFPEWSRRPAADLERELEALRDELMDPAAADDETD
jgi:hypothetical protein